MYRICMDTIVSMVQRTANVFVILKGAMKNVPNLLHTTYQFGFIHLLFSKSLSGHQISRLLNDQSPYLKVFVRLSYISTITKHNIRAVHAQPNVTTDLKMKSNQETKLMSKSNTRKVLKDFCESTSLHGYGYLYNNDSIFLKLFWLFVIFCMTGLSILLLVQNTIEFLEHEIYTTTETSSAPISVSKQCIDLYF